MANYMDNKEFCMAIYGIESYIKQYKALPPEDYIQPITKVEIGVLCKQIATDYFGHGEIYRSFSKKYKTKVRDIFKDRKKEVNNLYEVTEKNQPANIAENKKEDDKMITEKHFVAMVNIVTAFKRSGLSNKDFAAKIQLPSSSLSKMYYGNYAGKLFKDSPLRFVEVKEEAIDVIKGILGDGIIQKHYTDKVIGEQMLSNKENRTITLNKMTMFDVVCHGKLFTDDNVNVISDIGLTAIIKSKDNEFIQSMLNIINSNKVTLYNITNLKSLKRIRKTIKYKKSKISYNIEDIDNIPRVNDILNFLVDVKLGTTDEAKISKIVHMYNCILSYGYNINQYKAIEELNEFTSNGSPAPYASTATVIPKTTGFDKMDKSIDNEKMMIAYNASDKEITIKDIMGKLNNMTVEQLDVLGNYINEIKTTKVQMADAYAKLISLF